MVMRCFLYGALPLAEGSSFTLILFYYSLSLPPSSVDAPLKAILLPFPANARNYTEYCYVYISSLASVMKNTPISTKCSSSLGDWDFRGCIWVQLR